MAEIKEQDLKTFDKAALIKAKNDVANEYNRCINELNAINTELKEKEGSDLKATKISNLDDIKNLRERKRLLENERATLERMREGIDRELEELKLVKKSISLSNVRYLLKKNPSVKLGQIEAEAGLSTGYTSRMEKPDYKSDPPIEYLAVAADAFNVFLDTLVYAPLEEMTASEQYLLRFIEKLAKETTVEEMIWERDPSSYLNEEIEVDGSGMCNHPLLVPNKQDMDGYGNYGTVVYESHYFPEKYVKIIADPYHATMTGTNSILYIVPVKIQGDDYKDVVSGYELYIYDSNELTPICNTTQSHPAIGSAVTKLYSLIQETTAHARLDKKARSLIDAFMNPQQKKVLSPFEELDDDGELPF